jgi:DNA-binding NarL/FixJ family response regulator
MDGATDAMADAAMRSILVVDDHPLFCEALSLALRAGLNGASVHTASSLGEGLRMLRDGLEVDIVALDLSLPDVSGVDGLVRLKAATPRTPVVVVSGLTDNRIIAQALRAGASGFLRKDAARDALVAGMRRVLQGEVVTPPEYSPEAGRGEDAGHGGDAVERLAELTPQQLRILALVCEGRLNKQIAYELAIAETTVKAHITAILRKLGVQSRTQAVLIANKASYADILKGDGGAGSV